MKAEELMIGDWVIHPYYHRPAKIRWFNGSDAMVEYELVSVGSLKPVTITQKILEKIGIECAGAGFVGYFEESYSNQTVELSLFNVLIENRSIQLHIEDSTGMTLLHMMECNYVHELQHALRLCGINKEIVL